ncbi:MAG: DUF2975 domain-containing protein [Acidimicrobiales bacterium]
MTTTRSESVLKVLDTLLAIARVILIVVTALSVVLAILTLFRTTTTTLSGTTDAIAIEQTTPSGRVATHDPSTNTTTLDEGPPIGDLPDFGAAAVSIEIEDPVVRSVAVFVIAAWLGLGWFAVTNVRGITRASLAGTPFTMDNARRLQRTGAAAVGYAVMLVGVPLLMDALLSRVDLPVDGFRLDGGGGDAWLWLIVGLLIIAIAGAVERGVELQEFEETTI